MAVCFVGRRGPERMTDLLTCFVIDHYQGSRSRPGSLPLDGEHPTSAHRLQGEGPSAVRPLLAVHSPGRAECLTSLSSHEDTPRSCYFKQRL